MYASLGINT